MNGLWKIGCYEPNKQKLDAVIAAKAALHYSCR